VPSTKSSTEAPENDPTATQQREPTSTETRTVESTETIDTSSTASGSTLSETSEQTTTDTPGSTQGPTDSKNSIQVDSSYFEERSHIDSYSAAEVTAIIVEENPDLPASEVKLVCLTYRYPQQEVVASGASDPFSTPDSGSISSALGKTTETVVLNNGSLQKGERLYHAVFIMSADRPLDDVNEDDPDITKVHETNPFQITQRNRVVYDPPSEELDSASEPGFKRTPVEGEYLLYFRDLTFGILEDWETQFYLSKSAYAEAKSEPRRGSDFGWYVERAQKNGTAAQLAGILDSAANQNSLSGKINKTNFIIDFVQTLPYVPDNVRAGIDQYSQTVTETVAEGGGDCEDTAILLAALIQADPFGYDTVLIWLPLPGDTSHLATGVYGNDLPGDFFTYEDRSYYYIEPTAEDWDVGELPEVYQGADPIDIYQV
jgi:hypothetical protein